MHQHVSLKVSLGTTYKKTAVYSLMTGLTHKGLYRRTCGETGQWSDDAPTCDIEGFNISIYFIIQWPKVIGIFGSGEVKVFFVN